MNRTGIIKAHAKMHADLKMLFSAFQPWRYVLNIKANKGFMLRYKVPIKQIRHWSHEALLGITSTLPINIQIDSPRCTWRRNVVTYVKKKKGEAAETLRARSKITKHRYRPTIAVANSIEVINPNKDNYTLRTLLRKFNGNLTRRSRSSPTEFHRK